MGRGRGVGCDRHVGRLAGLSTDDVDDPRGQTAGALELVARHHHRGPGLHRSTQRAVEFVASGVALQDLNVSVAQVGQLAIVRGGLTLMITSLDVK